MSDGRLRYREGRREGVGAVVHRVAVARPLVRSDLEQRAQRSRQPGGQRMGERHGVQRAPPPLRRIRAERVGAMDLTRVPPPLSADLCDKDNDSLDDP